MKKQEINPLDEILKKLNSEFGSGTIISGSAVQEELEVIDSGSISLNKATSIGGIPIGKLIEIYGPESSGKSTLCLHIIANFQRAGKKVALCDSEQSFDRTYAASLGVDIEELLIIEPECAEDGYNIVENLIRTGMVGLVVIDSQTALVPRKVVEGEIGDAMIGIQARINSTALNKIHNILMKNKCTMISISQTRVNIGGYGDPNVPTGGHSYKFYSDMRLKVSKLLEKEDKQNRTTVEVVKNKCGIPWGKATFAIQWGTGIDRLQEIIDQAVDKGTIGKGGAGWYTVKSEKVQGDEKLKLLLNNNPELMSYVEKGE